MPYPLLIAHLCLAVFIVGRYQFLAASSGQAPKPQLLDLALGTTNAVVSWRLCKYITTGNIHLARVTFQVLAVQILLASAMAYRYESPEWFHTLAKMHNGFVYARWILHLGPRLGILNSHGETYTMAIFTGSILGVIEAKFPWAGIPGVPLLMGLLLLLNVFEKWTSSQATLQ